MIRKRNLSLIENSLGSDSMEPPVSVVRPDSDDFLEPDEELLCSVSDITEHLGRNISMVLETALSDIRQMVSIRIKVLKMELREKSEEIEALKARLETTGQRDAVLGGGGGVSAVEMSAEPKKHEPSSKNNNNNISAEARRSKVLPGVKKENIDAICDYLMKDKNSRGSTDMESSSDRDAKTEQEPPLSLWSDPGQGESESGEDLFSMLPTGGKRMYDYEWINPVDYSADLKVMKESGCEDGETTEGGEKEVLRQPNLNQNQEALINDQQLDFSIDHSSQGEPGAPGQSSTGRHDPVRSFPSHSFICSLCGTFCPGPAFLEEHIKLIHPDSVEAQALEALQSTAAGSGLGDNGTELNQGPGAQSENGTAPDATKPQRRCFGVKKEIRIEGGYQCGECGRCFNYLGNLRQHQRIHTGEKPFVCPECGERFRHAARLKSHRLVHSGNESPFPCPQCGKGFSVLSGLKRHQRVHTGESPYACPQCGRRFKELGNLYTHQRIHSGATPYCCQQCGRSFRHLGTYKSHRCIPGLLDTPPGPLDSQRPEHSGSIETLTEHTEHTGLAQST